MSYHMMLVAMFFIFDCQNVFTDYRMPLFMYITPFLYAVRSFFPSAIYLHRYTDSWCKFDVGRNMKGFFQTCISFCCFALLLDLQFKFRCQPQALIFFFQFHCFRPVPLRR